MRDYALSAYDAGVLVAEKESADFFEAVVARLKDGKRDEAASEAFRGVHRGRLCHGMPTAPAARLVPVARCPFLNRSARRA